MEAENNLMNEAQESKSSGHRSRRAVWAWIALVAVVAILAGSAGWMIGRSGRSPARRSASSSSSNREDRDRDEKRPSRESANLAKDVYARNESKIKQATEEALWLTDAILAYENFGRVGMPSPLKNKVTGETWQEATEDKLNFVLGKERMPNGQNGFMPVLYNGTACDGKICDPWGHAYRYRIMPSAGNANVSGHAKEYVVGVWSLGPDGEPNSDDDICTWPDLKCGTDGKAVSHRGTTITLPGGVELEMVYVEPGSFMMGDIGEKKHRERITEGFWLGMYEVTQAQWGSVMGNNPSHFKGANLPVESVSWNDCQDFIKKLNALSEVKKSGWAYRLPTEKEWEYACRAGSTDDYCKLADGTEIMDDTLVEVAWYHDKCNDKTHPVGQKKPNAFGFYDMHGNVWEWCEDLYQVGSSVRVRRGGSWGFGSRYCRASDRGYGHPGDRGSCFGFRLAASQDVTR